MFRKEKENNKKTPHFLWNAEMRFGKTFASYQLAKKMGWEKILVLTFKPAVQNAWEEDLKTHVDFESWQFIETKIAPNNIRLRRMNLITSANSAYAVHSLALLGRSPIFGAGVALRANILPAPKHRKVRNVVRNRATGCFKKVYINHSIHI